MQAIKKKTEELFGCHKHKKKINKNWEQSIFATGCLFNELNNNKYNNIQI